MEALGMEVAEAGTPSEQFRRFVAHVKREYEAGRRAVLVVDEAQNLGPTGLEELRVLSNLNTGRHMLLQTILIGQPELRTTLAMQQLRQFAQRIAIDHHLDPLSAEETIGYVRHRLAVAGGRPELFTPEAVELIHESTGGVPRLINLVCDTALVYAFSDQRASVGIDTVEIVIQDRASSGLLPLKAVRGRLDGALAAS
jgi:type II secretory pathway predicted ATPase ExeA